MSKKSFLLGMAIGALVGVVTTLAFAYSARSFLGFLKEFWEVIALMVTIAAQVGLALWNVRELKRIHGENRKSQSDLNTLVIDNQKQLNKNTANAQSDLQAKNEEYQAEAAKRASDLQKTIAVETRRAQFLSEARSEISKSTKVLRDTLSKMDHHIRIVIDKAKGNEKTRKKSGISHNDLMDALENARLRWGLTISEYASIFPNALPLRDHILDMTQNPFRTEKPERSTVELELKIAFLEEWRLELQTASSLLSQFSVVLSQQIFMDIFPRGKTQVPLVFGWINGKRVCITKSGEIDIEIESNPKSTSEKETDSTEGKQEPKSNAGKE